MQDYHTPDERWSIFGAKDFDEYARLYLVRGHFNNYVPADVIEGFKTAEYIMAHAYYYYPMYDEAFAKVLRLIELAIKKKCEELQIEIGRKPLKKLIEIVSKDLPAIKIQLRLEAVREVRNSVMHPDRHGFAGGTLRGSMVALVNIINELFLPVATYREQEVEVARIKQLLGSFERGLFALMDGEMRYLLYSIKCYTAIKADEEWHYYFVGFPILNDVKAEMEDLKVSRLLTWILSDVTLQDGIAKGKDMIKGHEISFTVTDKLLNIEQQKAFMDQLNTLAPQTIWRYGAIVEHNIDRDISEFLYQRSV